VRRIAVALATLALAVLATAAYAQSGSGPETTTPNTTQLTPATTTITEPLPVEDTTTEVIDTSSTEVVAVTTPPATVARPSTATVAKVQTVSALRPSSVSVAYGLGFATVLAIALGFIVLTTAARGAALSSGGSSMTLQRRTRLIAGAACLVLAAIVGLVGYLKLSLEPDINRQIPYLASSGMALVILAALGGALIVGEQMRTDQQRIEELEAAVESLAAMVGPAVEAPARTKARKRS
jgi:hypothetical protein